MLHVFRMKNEFFKLKQETAPKSNGVLLALSAVFE